MQELERPFAVDLVQAVEEFDVGAIAEDKRVVQQADGLRRPGEADDIAAGERLRAPIDLVMSASVGSIG